MIRFIVRSIVRFWGAIFGAEELKTPHCSACGSTRLLQIYESTRFVCRDCGQAERPHNPGTGEPCPRCQSKNTELLFGCYHTFECFGCGEYFRR